VPAEEVVLAASARAVSATVSLAQPAAAADALDAVAVRVLGALIEKQHTTPDNYPLTLNALTAACNQTTAREPVMQLSEADVLSGIDELTRRTLVRAVQRSDSRVRRYRQAMSETLSLHDAETAVMCVLMLRGAQTAGEIRTRSARLFEFTDLVQVEITLQSLMTLATPLVVQLPRQPGRKELRYAHLLAGEPQSAEAAEPAGADAGDAVAPAERDRVAALEQELGSLREEVAELRARFDEFARQFQ
jgi:uncharacterized protein